MQSKRLEEKVSRHTMHPGTCCVGRITVSVRSCTVSAYNVAHLIRLNAMRGITLAVNITVYH